MSLWCSLQSLLFIQRVNSVTDIFRITSEILLGNTRGLIRSSIRTVAHKGRKKLDIDEIREHARARFSSTCVTQQVSSLIFVAPQVGTRVISCNITRNTLSPCRPAIFGGGGTGPPRARIFNRSRLFNGLFTN